MHGLKKATTKRAGEGDEEQGAVLDGKLLIIDIDDTSDRAGVTGPWADRFIHLLLLREAADHEATLLDHHQGEQGDKKQAQGEEYL